MQQLCFSLFTPERLSGAKQRRVRPRDEDKKSYPLPALKKESPQLPSIVSFSFVFSSLSALSLRFLELLDIWNF